MLQALEAWLRATAVRIHEEAPALTALDQAIGDGDHGINLDRGFAAIVKALDARDRRPIPETTDVAASAELLKLVGRTLISTVGGASGPLYGPASCGRSAAVAAAGRPAAVGRTRHRDRPRGRGDGHRCPRQVDDRREDDAGRAGARSRGRPRGARTAVPTRWRSSPPPAMPPQRVPPRRSRCSRRRAGRPTSASAASATRIRARHRRRCSSTSSPASSPTFPPERRSRWRA